MNSTMDWTPEQKARLEREVGAITAAALAEAQNEGKVRRIPPPAPGYEGLILASDSYFSQLCGDVVQGVLGVLADIMTEETR